MTNVLAKRLDASKMAGLTGDEMAARLEAAVWPAISDGTVIATWVKERKAALDPLAFLIRSDRGSTTLTKKQARATEEAVLHAMGFGPTAAHFSKDEQVLIRRWLVATVVRLRPEWKP